jgi:hypothetical protein
VAKPEDAIEERLAALVSTLKRTGVVTGTSGTKVIVTVGGASLTLPRLATYTPVVNDTVNIIGPPPYLVLGKTA